MLDKISWRPDFKKLRPGEAVCFEKSELLGSPLLGLLSATSISDYFSPALKWNPSAEAFPARRVLEAIIKDEASRLYGEPLAQDLALQLQRSWAVETAIHLTIPTPKVFETFQTQLFWAAANFEHGNQLSVSTSTSRVPANNKQGANCIHLAGSGTKIKLTRDYNRDTPELLLPPIGADRIAQLEASNHFCSDQEYPLIDNIISIFKRHSHDFSDQIAAAHSEYLNFVFPENTINQVTLDSEKIGRKFLATQLRNSESLIYRIFANTTYTQSFLDAFCDIPSGWPRGGPPFYAVRMSQAKNTKGAPKFGDYEGPLTPSILANELETGRILPKGILKFFTLIVEGGLCCVGGVAQTQYVGSLISRSLGFLNNIFPEEKVRSAFLRVYPSHLILSLPLWGLRKTGGFLNLSDFITGTALSKNELHRIATMSGIDALAVGGKTLASSEKTGVNQDSLLRKAAVVRG